MTFHRGHLRPSENTDIYNTIPNSSKITAVKYGITMLRGRSPQPEELYCWVAALGKLRTAALQDVSWLVMALDDLAK